MGSGCSMQMCRHRGPEVSWYTCWCQHWHSVAQWASVCTKSSTTPAFIFRGTQFCCCFYTTEATKAILYREKVLQHVIECSCHSNFLLRQASLYAHNSRCWL